jgi:hypothetical protein
MRCRQDAAHSESNAVEKITARNRTTHSQLAVPLVILLVILLVGHPGVSFVYLRVLGGSGFWLLVKVAPAPGTP